MKTIVVYALVFVVLVNGGVSFQSIDEVNPYERLLRVRRATMTPTQDTENPLQPRPKICEPGSRKTDECMNTCICIIDGSGWGCTQMGCFHTKIDIIHQEITPTPDTENPLQPNPKICEPGSTKMDDCNTCFCNDDGSVWGCTEMGCNHEELITMNPNNTPTPDAENPSQPSLKICEPGSTKLDDCNTCFCTSDGSGWGCTLKGCYHEEISIIHEEITPTPDAENPLQPSLKICEPGSTKMDDCNTCFCISDGSGWGCTRKGCYHEEISITHPDITNTQVGMRAE